MEFRWEGGREEYISFWKFYINVMLLLEILY